MSRRISLLVALGTLLALTAACTNKKSVNPLANVGSKQPDKVLFDKAMDAMRHNRFDVARLTLQTLITPIRIRSSLRAPSWRLATPGTRRAALLLWRRPSRSITISRYFSPTCRKRQKRS